MPMYNLTEYSNNYSDTSGSLFAADLNKQKDADADPKAIQ